MYQNINRDIMQIRDQSEKSVVYGIHDVSVILNAVKNL